MRPVKTPSERGVTGAWAYQARQELGLSVEQVADAMALRGQAVSAATIRGIESGAKKPGARLLRVLSQVLESSAPGVASASELSLEERAVVAAERSAAAAEALLEATQLWPSGRDRRTSSCGQMTSS